MKHIVFAVAVIAAAAGVGAEPQRAPAAGADDAVQHLAAASRSLKDVASHDARLAELRKQFAELERAYKDSTTAASQEAPTTRRDPEAPSAWGAHYAKLDYLLAELFASHEAATGTSGATATKARPRRELDGQTHARLQEFRKHLEAFSAAAKPTRPAKPGEAEMKKPHGADLPPQTTTGAGAWETSRATGAPQATSPTALAQVAQPDTGTPQVGTSATAVDSAAHLRRIRELVEQSLRTAPVPAVRDRPGQPPTGLPAGTSGTGTAAAETAEAVGAPGKGAATVTMSRAALEEIHLRVSELERMLAKR